MAFLGNNRFSGRLRDFPYYYQQLTKDHFGTSLTSLKTTRTIWENFKKLSRSVNSSLHILPPSKISWLWNSMTSHVNLKSVASCSFVYNVSGWSYPDISWPGIESLSFICIFYFQFQLICNFCSEHWLALPNEMWRRQRLESTEIEHRPIVSTYKLLKILNPVCKF